MTRRSTDWSGVSSSLAKMELMCFQPMRDRSIAEPSCQFAQHLAFSGGQPVQRGRAAGLSKQRLHHERIEYRPAARHLVHRIGEFVETRHAFLQQVPRPDHHNTTDLRTRIEELLEANRELHSQRRTR